MQGKQNKTGEPSKVFKTQKTSPRWKGPPFQARPALTGVSKWSTKQVPEIVSQSTLKLAFTVLLSHNLYGLGHKGQGSGKGWRGWRLVGEKLRFLRPASIYNWPSISIGFVSMDSSNHGLKMFGKSFQNVSRGKLGFAMCLTLYNTYTIVDIISNLEMIYSIHEKLYRLYANTMPF